MKKLLALVLAVLMVVSVMAGCKPADTGTTVPSGPVVDNSTTATDPVFVAKPRPNWDPNATYTYNVAMSVFPNDWNIHTYQTATDAEIADWITDGFYKFDYNESYNGYALVPGMTTDEHPIDVTSEYVGQYGVEEGDKAKVYIINLRQDLKWEDGSPINAHDFVESAKRLLNPAAQNYRADSLYSGNMVIHNAQMYLNNGSHVTAQENNLAPTVWTMDDFTKNADGVYTTPQGEIVYVAVNSKLQDWLSGYTLATYVGAYGDTYFDTSKWDVLTAAADENGLAPLNDTTLDALITTIAGNPAWGESEADVPNYLKYDYTYPETSWEDVGMFAKSDYELVIAIDQPLEGFYLKYSLTGSWLVNTKLYDALTTTDAEGNYVNTYGTSVATTMSYGPSKLTSFQQDAPFVLERNDYYYDITENTYWTTHIVYDYVPEATTRLEMFLAGELDSYGLQDVDMEDYSKSDYCYYTTGDSTFAMVFNPDKEALETMQAAAGANINKTILTLVEFRQAMSFSIDRAAFCLATSPTNSAAFGLFSTVIISDPESGTPYRTTDVSKQTLVEFWGVADDIGEGKMYASIDEAIESITGYNLTKGQQLFNEAYDKAIAEGLMDADDVIEIKIGTPNNTANFYNKGYEFIVNNYTEAVKGTKLEGKLTFSRDDTLGNGFSDALKSNQVDMLFGVGWTGSALDPYGLMEAYIGSNYQYDPAIDYSSIMVTINVNGTDYTADALTWYDAMAGKTVSISDAAGNAIEYSCGSADGDPATRLQILGALENEVLLRYDFIPLMDDSSASLKGQQLIYNSDFQGVGYIFGVGFGGVKYMMYEYTDAEWEAYVAENNGELSYK